MAAIWYTTMELDYQGNKMLSIQALLACWFQAYASACARARVFRSMFRTCPGAKKRKIWDLKKFAEIGRGFLFPPPRARRAIPIELHGRCSTPRARAWGERGQNSKSNDSKGDVTHDVQ